MRRGRATAMAEGPGPIRPSQRRSLAPYGTTLAWLLSLQHATSIALSTAIRAYKTSRFQWAYGGFQSSTRRTYRTVRPANASATFCGRRTTRGYRSKRAVHGSP